MLKIIWISHSNWNTGFTLGYCQSVWYVGSWIVCVEEHERGTDQPLDDRQRGNDTGQ